MSTLYNTVRTEQYIMYRTLLYSSYRAVTVQYKQYKFTLRASWLAIKFGRGLERASLSSNSLISIGY